MTWTPPRRLEWNYCPICGAPLVERHDGESNRPNCAACKRFYYLNPVPAACCFVKRGDELLFVQRSVEPCRGMWSLPGGFVELGESTEETALRELLEETGLVGRDPVLLGASTRGSRRKAGGVTVLGYVVEEWEGTLVPRTDAMDARFCAKGDRPELAFEVHRELMALYDERYPG